MKNNNPKSEPTSGIASSLEYHKPSATTEYSITPNVENLSCHCQKLWKPKSEIVAMPLDMNCELQTKVGGMNSVCFLRERERESEFRTFPQSLMILRKKVHLYGACPWYNGRSSCICWTWCNHVVAQDVSLCG
jgi:hypothetical protein